MPLCKLILLRGETIDPQAIWLTQKFFPKKWSLQRATKISITKFQTIFSKHKIW